jgi:hypothetical protein
MKETMWQHTKVTFFSRVKIKFEILLKLPSEHSLGVTYFSTKLPWTPFLMFF